MSRRRACARLAAPLDALAEPLGLHPLEPEAGDVAVIEVEHVGDAHDADVDDRGYLLIPHVMVTRKGVQQHHNRTRSLINHRDAHARSLHLSIEPVQ